VRANLITADKAAAKTAAKIVFVLLLGCAVFLCVVPLAQAVPMYSWGANTHNCLGRPTNGSDHNPTRVGTATNWVSSSTASQGGSFAVNAQGYVYTWGRSGPERGLGAGTTARTEPYRIPTLSNMATVSSFASTVISLSKDGHIYTWGGNLGRPTGTGVGYNHTPGRIVIPNRPDATFQYATTASAARAICEDGYLYTWIGTAFNGGTNTNGVLGRPIEGPGSVPAGTPGRVGDKNNWVITGGAASISYALNADGYVYTWGINASGRLGRPVVGAYSNEPGRVPGLSDVVDIIMTNSAGAAVTADGYIYTWGVNAAGQLGQGVALATHISTPTRIAGDDWVSVMGGQQHFLTFNSDGVLYGWGQNSSGQIGGEAGPGGSINAPARVLETTRFSTAARGGGLHSILLVDTRAVSDSYVYKDLRKPEGTHIPDLTFSFSMVARSFNNGPVGNNFPPNSTNLTRTVTINSTSDSAISGGVVTLTSYADLLANITFTQPGTYSWTIEEMDTVTPPLDAFSEVGFSNARYELRVEVGERPLPVGYELYVYEVTRLRERDTQGNFINPPLELDGDESVVFTNTYKRTTLGTVNCYGAFWLSKAVEGNFADTTVPFDFDITIAATALCPAGTTFDANVYRANGVFDRAYTFTSGISRHVQLLEGEKIVFDEVLVGTRFLAVERAMPEFTASLSLIVNGAAAVVTTNPNPDLELSTGELTIIEDATINYAAFTNIHFFTPPMGLVLGDGAAPVIIVGAGIMFAALLATKSRKRIEEIESIEPLEQVDPPA